MADTRRINLMLAPMAADELDALASELHLRRTDIVRMALALLRQYEKARRAGHVVGSAADPAKLDQRFVSL